MLRHQLHSGFCPLLKHVIPKVVPPFLMGLALASGRSILEPAGISFVRHGGSFWLLLTAATPVTPPLPKPCHTSPMQWEVLALSRNSFGGRRDLLRKVRKGQSEIKVILLHWLESVAVLGWQEWGVECSCIWSASPKS